MNKVRLLFLSISLSTQMSQAQEVFMRKIEHDNGIQAHDIYSVFEDSRHYLWFTSDGGVWRFDGKNYKNFTTEHGMPDNVVFLFSEDRHNRIWFNTYSSKIAFIEKDSVHTLPCNDSLSQLKKMEIPASIYVDRNDVVWLSYFRSKDYITINPPYKKENIRLVPAENVFFSVDIDGDGMIAGSMIASLAQQNEKMVVLKNGRQKAEMTNAPVLISGHRTSCYKQYDGSFLISADNCLGEYKNGVLKRKTVLKYTILSALKDIYNNYWISTIDGGLFFYRKNDSTFSDPEVYLKSKSVGRILQDHEDAYWITTLNDGVYYIPHIDMLLLNSANGLSDNISYVFSDTFDKSVFCMDAKGNLYIIKNGVISKTINCSVQPDKLNQVKNIIPLNKSAYLFVGRSSFKLNTKNWKIEFTPALDRMNTATLHQNTLWISKQSRVFKVNAQSLLIEKDVNFKAKINSIYPLNDSILWLGTERGLLRYNHIQNTLLPTPASIKNQGIISIIRLFPEKNLIIYKSDGILIVDDAMNLVSRLMLNVKGYSIKHVTKDRYGNTWISTNKGALKIDPQLNISNVHEHHGLPSNIINAISTDDKLVYVACEKGLIQFPIQKNFLNRTPPDIYLNSVQVNNVAQVTDTAFNLNYDQNFIKVFFTTINYRASNHITCRYKMEGVDPGWKTTPNNEIEYTTLPPGDYQLTIYAVNNDDIASLKKISLRFLISPPFWKTWWFISLGAFFLILSILVIFKWRVSLVRKRSKEKSDLQEQLGQMEMQALRSQMNPHFIFNAINSIQHYILSNEPLLANKFLVKFSKLIRNVLEQSKQELIPLKEEIETLRFYIEIESLRFEDSFSYDITISDTLDQSRLRIPSLILQPYVENAIWHGLLLKKGKKELTIDIHEKNGYLIVEIDDNGIGRQASSAFKRAETKKRSLGMEITRGRLDLLSRSLGVQVDVQVIDKMNDENEAAGTTVIIKTPLLY